ncbi:MAG: hypothetical protein RL538_710 [Candidatus Parcubacteria bacterium]|jgi:hypothetical protein
MSEKLSANERDPEHWDLRAILAKGRRVMENIRDDEEVDRAEKEGLEREEKD